MIEKSILIVTHTDDIHADIVIEKIKDLNTPAFRLNLDMFPRNYDVNIQQNNDAPTNVEINCSTVGGSIASANIGAVWLRKKAEYSLPSCDSAQEIAFAQDEMDHLLLGYFHTLKCYWMSHPSALRQALWKIEQLDRARGFGVATPKTIMTNSVREAKSFMDTIRGDIIFKPLSSSTLAAEKVNKNEIQSYGIATTKITKDDTDILESVEDLPTLFQEYVPKKYEVRATVIEDKVFAVRIFSQNDERTSTDYRDYGADIPYEPVELPSEVRRFCVDFVRSYGLTYGALDFIITDGNEYVFLENNPVGQFLFVEELAPTLKISDCIARTLIAGAAASQ